MTSPAALDPPTTAPAPVGARVRALREAMGLSLRDLAARSTVSAPMLSQVERGETSPTLAVADRIAAGLELSLSQLLRLDEGDGVSLVRAAERRRGGARGRGHRYEVLTPPIPGQRAEVSMHTLEPAAGTGGPEDPPMHEPGSRETAVVTEGRLGLVCGGRRYDLAEGDAVTFDADLPHRFENPGAERARAGTPTRSSPLPFPASAPRCRSTRLPRAQGRADPATLRATSRAAARPPWRSRVRSASCATAPLATSRRATP